MWQRRTVGYDDVGPQPTRVGERDVHRAVERPVVVHVRFPQHGVGDDVAHDRLVVVVADQVDVGRPDGFVHDGSNDLGPVGHSCGHSEIRVGE